MTEISGGVNPAYELGYAIGIHLKTAFNIKRIKRFFLTLKLRGLSMSIY